MNSHFFPMLLSTSIRRYAASWVVLLLTSSFTARADEPAKVIRYRANTGLFDEDGPGHVTVDALVTLIIEDDDPRRAWAAAVAYEQPVTATAAEFLRTALSRSGIVVPTVSALDAQVSAVGAIPAAERDRLLAQLKALADAEQVLRISLERFVQSEHTRDLDLGMLRTRYSELQQALSALDALVQGSRYLKGPPIAARNPNAPAEVVQLAQVLAAGREQAVELLSTTGRIIRTAEEAVASRVRAFRVREGFNLVTVRACYQVVISEGPTGPQQCSQSSYSVRVDGSLRYLNLSVGMLVGIQSRRPSIFYIAENGDLVKSPAESRFSEVEPLVTVGAKYTLHEPSTTVVGGELGFGIGAGIGDIFALGGFFGVAGLNVGAGVYLDTEGDRVAIPGVISGAVEQRTRPIASINPYVRLGLSTDLYDLLQRSPAATGAQNVFGKKQPPAPSPPTGSHDSQGTPKTPASEDGSGKKQSPAPQPDTSGSEQPPAGDSGFQRLPQPPNEER